MGNLQRSICLGNESLCQVELVSVYREIQSIEISIWINISKCKYLNMN